MKCSVKRLTTADPPAIWKVLTDAAGEEVFSGLMLGPISKTMPDLQPSFERFADSLEKRLEG